MVVRAGLELLAQLHFVLDLETLVRRLNRWWNVVYKVLEEFHAFIGRFYVNWHVVPLCISKGVLKLVVEALIT